MTRKEAVLKALRPRRWTPGHTLISPKVGGTEGLRRLRELRADGYTIIKRQMKGSRSFEYRLTGTPGK